MLPERPQNPLHERYASRRMARLFTAGHRFATWRRLWIALAECQRELGLPITEAQLAALRRVAGDADLERVAELERQTRHDVVAHLRHFAEQAGEAGAVLHLGATSMYVVDNTDGLLVRDALRLVESRLIAAIRPLAEFARRHRELPTLAYTHLQPAQLTTVGKRACLWLQDLLTDLAAVRRLVADLRCRGVKGTTGTQASFLELFDGDHEKVKQLDRLLTERIGFAASYPVTGQTYPRKQDSQVLACLAGVAESCHRLGGDVRLLQGLGELSEPFDSDQVGSSAMAYKKNPVRSERMCGLARRLLTDSLNGPLTASLQWLERSLDDSANRRLVLADAFLTCDALLLLASDIGGGLTPLESGIAARVARELPFMATENLLMKATVRGGDRQQLHEQLRRHSLAAHEAVAGGEPNPLLETIAGDAGFGLDREEIFATARPEAFIGRAPEQVDEFLAEVLEPALAGAEELEPEPLRV
ncbi:MAG: adenylosuccinate lyase [Thermoanaerobaculia bacterium]